MPRAELICVGGMHVLLLLMIGVVPLKSSGQEAEVGAGSKSLTKTPDVVSTLDDIFQWYRPSSYDSISRMLFVETKNPSPSIAHARAQLAIAAQIEIEKVARDWLNSDLQVDFEVSETQIFEELVYQNRIAFAEDVITEVKAAEETGQHAKLFKGYLQLHLDKEFEASVVQQASIQRKQLRLWGTGLAGGAILLGLTLLFVYLKLENATRGFYSRRLQTLFAAVAIVAFTILYWLSQQVS
ncbi:MAG: hypothetical protein AAGA30_20545 [Planctomycetota bacterium]